MSPPLPGTKKEEVSKPRAPSPRYRIQMAEYTFTEYFEKEVLRKRPYLRVITLEDKVTIHNAFPDRRFKP